MKSEYSFYYCCGVGFSKIYSKLIRDVKKQLGKSRFSKVSLSGTDGEPKIHWAYDEGFIDSRRSFRKTYLDNVCINCQRKHNSSIRRRILMTKFTLKIEEIDAP